MTNPFTQAISTVTAAYADAEGLISAHVNTTELVSAAVQGALSGVAGGPVGIGIGAVESIVADLPKITTPDDAKLFMAGLGFAEAVYARLHPPTP